MIPTGLDSGSRGKIIFPKRVFPFFFFSFFFFFFFLRTRSEEFYAPAVPAHKTRDKRESTVPDDAIDFVKYVLKTRFKINDFVLYDAAAHTGGPSLDNLPRLLYSFTVRA